MGNTLGRRTRHIGLGYLQERSTEIETLVLPTRVSSRRGQLFSCYFWILSSIGRMVTEG